MRLTISSFLIMLVMTSILIVLFHLLLTRKKSHVLFRTDFLTIVLVVILCRILLPIELPFTFSLYSTAIMTTVRDFLLFEIRPSFSMMHLLLIVWLIGSMIQLIRYISKVRGLQQLLKSIQQDAQHHAISDYIPEEQGTDVYVTGAVSTPMVMGSKPSIYLPETAYTKEELHNILYHELQHIHHKDLWIKQLINGVVILYWWFLPVYVLRKQIDLYLEMRADNAVIGKMSREEYLEYAQSILDVQRKQVEQKGFPSRMITCFISDGMNSLSYRLDFLLQGEPKRKTNGILLLLAFVLPFLSNAVIIEPSYMNDIETTKGTFTEDQMTESYIIEYADGTYTLVVDGKKIPLTELPTSIEIPIIIEGESVKQNTGKL